MRTNAVYVRRRQVQQSLSISPICPHDMNSCIKESVQCDVARNHTAFQRTLGDGDMVGQHPDSLEEDNIQQQPAAQGLQLNGHPQLIEAKEVHKEPCPARPTKTILQDIINFFSAKVTSPTQLPRDAPIPPPQSMMLPGKDQATHPHESKSADKENIPPQGASVSTAVSMLQDFRRKASVKQRLIKCPPAPHAARRIAPRNFGELSPGEVADSSVIKTTDERTMVQRSTADYTIQRKHEKSWSRNSTSKHKNSVENGTTDIINREKKNAVIRRSRREENSTGTVLVSRKHMNWFLQLVEDPLVAKFLKVDICRRYADKYLLAMVFTYFVRAGLKCHQYSKENFFAALYLAHDMEEDEEELKYEVFPWALGQRWRKTYPSLLRIRDDIFWSIDCRAVVSKRCCDQVMEMQPEHWLWERDRPTYHGGALREHLKHPNDNGHPRGPDKSPLQCQTCFERECSNSQNSYLLYLSESDASTDSSFMAQHTEETCTCTA
ncbi:uncharacterized protein [Panulirus ornatus]|uniref:uncharacterized protein isoform X2 n=1 Tax=Panulirus ornatus TaxID=150431 RepID=UPI003A890133